ncbi:MAG: mechanosensitive ion channel family protein [Sulfolobales archaeon]
MDVQVYITYIVATAASIMLYVISSVTLFKQLARVLGKEMLIVLRIAMILLSISVFLAFTSYLYGAHEIFVLIFTLFIISFLVIVMGARHVLEEYVTGIFASKAYDLRVGDYIEVGSIKGYITALDDTSIIIKDSRKGLIHIPYTMLTHTPFKRVKPEEGYEIRIQVFLPHEVDVDRILEDARKIARELGLDDVKADIESIEKSGVVILVRGLIRDPRREDEIKYSILDKLYKSLSQPFRVS